MIDWNGLGDAGGAFISAAIDWITTSWEGSVYPAIDSVTEAPLFVASVIVLWLSLLGFNKTHNFIWDLVAIFFAAPATFFILTSLDQLREAGADGLRFAVLVSGAVAVALLAKTLTDASGKSQYGIDIVLLLVVVGGVLFSFNGITDLPLSGTAEQVLARSAEYWTNLFQDSAQQLS